MVKKQIEPWMRQKYPMFLDCNWKGYTKIASFKATDNWTAEQLSVALLLTIEKCNDRIQMILIIIFKI